MKPGTILKALVISLAAVVLFFQASDYFTDVGKERLAAKAAREEARKEEDKREVARSGLAAHALASVRASLRNPQSVQWDSVLTNDDATVICIDYRAQNGFGGMGYEFVTFVDGKPNPSDRAWNTNCSNHNLHNVKKLAVAILERRLSKGL